MRPFSSLVESAKSFVFSAGYFAETRKAEPRIEYAVLYGFSRFGGKTHGTVKQVMLSHGQDIMGARSI